VGALRLLTTRLELRPWTLADIDDLMEGLKDMAVARWLARVPHPYSRADAEAWIRYCEGLVPVERGGKSREWAISLRSQGQVIGGVSLERVNQFQGTAGGGIWLGARYAGNGYGREAFGEKVRHAFEDLGLRRLENGFLAGNDASWRMQEALGYRIEGTRRQGLRCLADGRIVDEVLTGLLREEWKRS